MIRWLKFSTVGIAGTGVQLLALYRLLKFHMNYLAATALAVETAVLHNYIWHSSWTWRGRPGSFWRFQLSNGLVSIGSNLILMRLLTGWAGIPVVRANLAAIAMTSLLNFWFSDRWVFPRFLRHLGPGTAEGFRHPVPVRHATTREGGDLPIHVVLDSADEQPEIVKQ